MTAVNYVENDPSLETIPEVITKQEGQARMNHLGASGTPFLFLIDFEAKQWLVEPLETLNSKNIAFNFNGKGNAMAKSILPSDKAIWFEKYPIAYARYLEAFQEVVTQQRNGNSFLTNLTFPTPIVTNLTLEEIFQYSSARYKLRVGDEFVVFSPETFVQINDGVIASCPMKGTIDASLPNAAQRILDDEKEKAEHATIVDLIRNDLSRVASQVQVERYRYIERLTTSGKRPLAGVFPHQRPIAGRLPAPAGRYFCRTAAGRFHQRGAQTKNAGDHRGGRTLRTGFLHRHLRLLRRPGCGQRRHDPLHRKNAGRLAVQKRRRHHRLQRTRKRIPGTH